MIILLDLKKYCQAIPSIANSIPSELPIALYSPYADATEIAEVFGKVAINNMTRIRDAERIL